MPQRTRPTDRKPPHGCSGRQPPNDRAQRRLSRISRRVRWVAGRPTLSSPGVIVHGSSCTSHFHMHTTTSNCAPRPPILLELSLIPHSYGNNFPFSRHSRLVVTLGEHELAAEAQSVFSLLPDALMLQIACSCDEVRATHTHHLQTQPTHSAGNSHANRRRVSSLAAICSRPRSLACALPCRLARRSCRHAPHCKRVGRMEINAFLPPAPHDRGCICAVSARTSQLPPMLVFMRFLVLSLFARLDKRYCFYVQAPL